MSLWEDMQQENEQVDLSSAVALSVASHYAAAYLLRGLVCKALAYCQHRCAWGNAS